MSKQYNLQKILFGEIAFDNDFNKIKTKHCRIPDDDYFNNAKVYKMSNIIKNQN